MTKFFQTNDMFRIAKDSSFTMLDALPPANFLVKQNLMTGEFFLEKTDSFKRLPKVYGKGLVHANRILNTFLNRPHSTGALLAGEKGSGKTLLAREISILAAEQGIPTIIINAAYAGEAFMEFMSNITQPTVLLFDEFEKVYSPKKNDGQESILTLLDGVFQSRKLFLLTCNDKFAINQHMINRPGRLFYTLEFDGLTMDFIMDYLKAELNDQSYIEAIVKIVHIFKTFNFDMLKALVEEMNRYDESPHDALQLLNINPARDYARYKVDIKLGDGSTIYKEHTNPNELNSPLSQRGEFCVNVYYNGPSASVLSDPAITPEMIKNGDYEDDRDSSRVFTSGDIVRNDGKEFYLQNKSGDILKLIRIEEKQFDWRAF